MKTQSKRNVLWPALLAAALLTGCAAHTNTLYEWGSYQAEVYDYFKGESKEKQIAELEKDLEKMQAKDRAVPPGVRAHLGMLYAEAGNDGKAVEMLQTEKARYPESATYVDFLLKKYQKQQ
jgi:hypothetical protein